MHLNQLLSLLLLIDPVGHDLVLRGREPRMQSVVNVSEVVYNESDLLNTRYRC